MLETDWNHQLNSEPKQNSCDSTSLNLPSPVHFTARNEIEGGKPVHLGRVQTPKGQKQVVIHLGRW